jgi:hypothetical protein
MSGGVYGGRFHEQSVSLRVYRRRRMSTNFYWVVGSLVGTSSRTGNERIEALDATQRAYI